MEKKRKKSELEFIAEVRELRNKLEEMERLRLVLETSHIGAWTLDMEKHNAFRSPEHDRIFGYGEPLPEWTYEMFLEHILPEDRAMVDERFRRAKETCGDWNFECRIRRADGEVRWIWATGRQAAGVVGNTRFMTGIVQDITGRKESEENVRRVAQFPEENPNPVLRVAADSELLYANQPAREWLLKFGWKAGGNLPERLLNIVGMASAKTGAVEDELKAPDGSVFIFTAVRPETENYVNLYGKEITQSKKAEEALRESEAKFSAVFHSSPGGISISRLDDGLFIDVNDAYLKMVGYMAHEIIGKRATDLDIWQDPRQREEIVAILRKGGLVTNHETSIKRKDGQVVEFLYSALVLEIEGERCILGALTDITERKKTEEALRQSERLYRGIGEAIDYGVWVCAPDGRNIYASESFLNMVGITQQECSDYGWGDVLHPDDAERTIAAWKECVRTEGKWDIEHRFRGVDGKWHSVLARGVPVRDDQGKITFWAGINLDISRLKKTEDDLKQIRKDLDRAQEVGQIGSWRLDVADNILTWSDETHRIFGLPRGSQMSYETFLGTIHPEDREYVDERWRAALRGDPYDIEHRIISGGMVKWVREKAFLEFDVNGELKGGFGITQDITDRKMAEEAIAELNERLELSQESSGIGVWDWNLSSGHIEWTPKMFDLLGLEAEKDKASLETWKKLIHPEDLKRAETKISKALEERHTLQNDYRIMLPSGEIRWISALGKGFYNEAGKPLRMLGVCMDITERKLVEEKLCDSNTELKLHEEELVWLNRMLKALGDSSQAMMRAEDEQSYLDNVCRIVIEDCGYAMVWVGYAENDENSSVTPVAHYGFEEGYLETIRISWADNEQGNGPTGTAIRTGKPVICCNMLTDPKFEPWKAEALKQGYSSSVVLPLLSEGKAFGAVSICSKEPDSFTDEEVSLLSELAGDLAYGIGVIRQRKAREQAETVLAAKHQELQLIMDSAASAIFYKDRENRFVRVNRSLANSMGMKKEDLEGRSCYEIYPRLQAEAYWRDDQEVMASGTPRFGIIEPMQSPEGERWMQTDKVPFRDEDGNIIGIMGFSLDITDHKRAEDDLRKLNEQLEMRVEERTAEVEKERRRLYEVLETLPAMICLLKPDHRIVFANRSFREKYGESEGRYCYEACFGCKEPCNFCETYRVLETGRPHHWEATSPDGNTVIDVYDFPFTDVDGSPLILEMDLDITERKVAEQRIKAERKRLEDVLETLPAYVCLLTKDYRMPFANKVFRDLFGYSPEKKCYEFLFDRKEPCEICETFKVLQVHQPLQWLWTGPNGRYYDVFDFPFKDTDGSELILEMGIDVTERRRAEAALMEAKEKLEERVSERTAALADSTAMLRVSLAEKEVLLKEIHHRVKNNMQVISSLVSLQADKSRDEAMKAVLQEVTHRVRSMALVHETLYQSKDMSEVNFASYANNLLNYLWTANRSESASISLVTDLEPVFLSVNSAVPCALILNELVTNSLKHAFKGREKGAVTVSLKRLKDGRVRMAVSDSGRGLPKGYDWESSDTLGMSLVRMLAAQLKAEVEIDGNGGTSLTLCFSGGNQ